MSAQDLSCRRPAAILSTLLLAALAPLAAPAMARGDAAACAAQDRSIRAMTPLSACRGADGNVAIGAGTCTNVFVDQNYTGTSKLGAVTIGAGGALYVPDATLEVEAASITIVGTSGGGAGATALFQVGTDACPVGSLNPANHVTLTFTGERPKAEHVHVHDHKSGDDCTSIQKGIGVGLGGALKLYGARGVPPDGVSWTYLAKPAGPAAYQVAGADTLDPYANKQNIGSPVIPGGELKLHLAANVLAGPNPWKDGDWIVIGTTSFSPFESEFVQIEIVEKEGSGSVVTLKAATPLRHYHFEGADPGPAHDPSVAPGAASASFKGTVGTNFGVDERAEVGLISRSITLTSATPKIETSGDTSLHWGGEMRFCKGYSDASVQGVEIEKFGKEQLGSYPIHFHLANESQWVPGTRPKPPSGRQLVDANSIHHSYNKCATIHSSSKIAFSNNVCARITGHVFYQEIGDEFETTFRNNLGLGTMLNGFGLPPALQPTPDAIVEGWWEGDYLGRAIGFDGLNIANTDSGTNPTTGQCYTPGANGLAGGTPPPGQKCTDGKVLYEAPTGFWIVNPTAILDGNSIGGCQSLGKGYWYVAPRLTPGDSRYALKFLPVGRFTNNRVHGCYDGIFGETDAGTIVEQMQPKVNGDNNDLNLIARFDGFTASRIRNRGVWMRPLWNVFDNARVSSSREDVSLVTSGGLDGNGPGVWGLLKNSVVVGWSRNNVDRWGPCPSPTQQEGHGCVDRNPNASDLYEKGYPDPSWNFAGFYIYDGPVRIHDTRFVNFRKDVKSLLTATDVSFLNKFSGWRTGREYEGDAALGWFQNNQSAYPTSTETRGLVFENTDLRHQVFTDKVNFGNFDDGDKNTAVVDRDGTLTGFRVVDGANVSASHRYPVSLNNLPFNATGNAVDECLATGAQDATAEGRPTSLISPADIATLEFGALTVPSGLIIDSVEPKITQLMTFTHDTRDLFDLHRSMTLHSRNNQGVWEPKIASGRGYTVSVGLGGERPAGVRLRRAARHPALHQRRPDRHAEGRRAHEAVLFARRRLLHQQGRLASRCDVRGRARLSLVGRQRRQLQRSAAPQVLQQVRQPVPAADLPQPRPPAEPVADQGRGQHRSAERLPGGRRHAARIRGHVQGPGRGAREVVGGDRRRRHLPLRDARRPVRRQSRQAHRRRRHARRLLQVLLRRDDRHAVLLRDAGFGERAGARRRSAAAAVSPTTILLVRIRSTLKFPESYYGCPAQGCVTYTIRMNDGAAYDPGASACGDPSDESRKSDPAAIYRVARNGDGVGKFEQPGNKDLYHLAYVPSPQSPHEDVRAGLIVKADPKPGSKGFPHVEARFPPYLRRHAGRGLRRPPARRPRPRPLRA